MLPASGPHSGVVSSNAGWWGSPSRVQASWGAQGPLLQGQTDRQCEGAVPSGARKLGRGGLCPLTPCLNLSPGMRTSPRVPPQWPPLIDVGEQDGACHYPWDSPFCAPPSPQV